MEDSKFKTKVNATKDKIKRMTIKTKILSIALAFLVIIIFVSLFFPLQQDPDTFTDPAKRSQWITNTVLTISISLIALICFESIVTDLLKNNVNGRYQLALNGRVMPDGKFQEGYIQKREKVRPMEKDFSNWVDWFDKRELRKEKLKAIASDDAERVLDHIDEIDNPMLLCDHIEISKKHWFSRKREEEVKGVNLVLKDGTRIEKKTELQVKGIMAVKNGFIRIHPYEPPYYLSIDSVSLNVSQVNKAYFLNKAKGESQTFSRTYKILTMVLMSVFWALVTVNDFSNLADAKAWFLFIARLCALMGGCFTGWSGADMNVKFDIDMVNDRSAILDTFYHDMTSGTFDPKKYEYDKRKEVKDYELPAQDDYADGIHASVYVGEERPGYTGQSQPAGLVSVQDKTIPMETK